MAQITAHSTHGLFNASAIPLTKLAAAGKEVSFTADLSDCRDSVIALIDIPSGGTGSHTLVIKSCEGLADISIPLVAEKLNIVRFTTKGFKGDDGNASFKYITDNSSGIGALGISLCFVKYTPVIAH